MLAFGPRSRTCDPNKAVHLLAMARRHDARAARVAADERSGLTTVEGIAVPGASGEKRSRIASGFGRNAYFGRRSPRRLVIGGLVNRPGAADTYGETEDGEQERQPTNGGVHGEGEERGQVVHGAPPRA